MPMFVSDGIQKWRVSQHVATLEGSGSKHQAPLRAPTCACGKSGSLPDVLRKEEL